jgi:hypothetical protein
MTETRFPGSRFAGVGAAERGLVFAELPASDMSIFPVFKDRGWQGVGAGGLGQVVDFGMKIFSFLLSSGGGRGRDLGWRGGTEGSDMGGEG